MKESESRQLRFFLLSLLLFQMSCATEGDRRQAEPHSPGQLASIPADRPERSPEPPIQGHDHGRRSTWYYPFESPFPYYGEKLDESGLQRGPGIECGRDGHDLKGCR